MKISVKELSELQNSINESLGEAFEKGQPCERKRKLPNTLFDALLEYGKKSETLVDYHKSGGGELDDCNWVHLKPTREGSEGVAAVEISFSQNLMEIDFIGIIKEEESEK